MINSLCHLLDILCCLKIILTLEYKCSIEHNSAKKGHRHQSLLISSEHVKRNRSLFVHRHSLKIKNNSRWGCMVQFMVVLCLLYQLSSGTLSFVCVCVFHLTCSGREWCYMNPCSPFFSLFFCTTRGMIKSICALASYF